MVFCKDAEGQCGSADVRKTPLALLRGGRGPETYQKLWPQLVKKLARLRSGEDNCVIPNAL